jgi:hypothetical protein
MNCNISKVLEIDNYNIVLYDVQYNEFNNENINCITKNGDIIWIIQKSRNNKYNSPYVNIFLKGRKLYAVNYDGWTEEINFENGKIVNSIFTK